MFRLEFPFKDRKGDVLPKIGVSEDEGEEVKGDGGMSLDTIS